MRPNDGRVVSNFIVQATHNLPLTLYGDGKQTRSFCYVSDLIDGIVGLLRHEDTGPSPDSVETAMQHDIHFPINIGNPSEYSVLELAHKIKDLSKSSSTIEFKPLPTDDPKVRQPDIQRAKHLLNWQPSIPLEEGLLRTISYFSGLFQEREGKILL